ncbi:PA14 domain-containing protein [Sporomusa ovata]|nr:PA14 domain-containing protein [Sporomusa ovata]
MSFLTTFALNSDDGSRLYIDGNLAIDNDGIHSLAMEEASVFLNPGTHSIRVEYFQGPRYELALQLFITPPGGEQTIFSLADYPPEQR